MAPMVKHAFPNELFYLLLLPIMEMPIKTITHHFPKHIFAIYPVIQ